MKKSNFFFQTALAIITLFVVSCSSDNPDSPFSSAINYPAAFVVNGSSNNISVVKLSDNSITKTITLNDATFPHHIYLSPDKTKIAIAITSMDLSGGHEDMMSMPGTRIQIVSTSTGTIEKEIPLAKMPHNATFNPSGTELWIGQMDEMASSILVYKTSDWTLQNTITVGMGLSETTFSKDGTMVFACNTMEGTVSVINPSDKMVMATITVGEDPIGAWPASNGKMYVDNEMSQTVSEISVASMTVTNTIDLGFKPGYVAFNSMNNELWVSDATNGKVKYYTFDTGMGMWMESGMIATGANAHAIAFTSDGMKAFVTNQDENTVSVIDTMNHTVSAIIAVGTKPNGIAVKE